MNNDHDKISSYLFEIENILFDKCKPLKNPLLSHDLSFVLIQAVEYKYSKDEKYKKTCLQFVENLIECFSEIEFGVGFLESFEGIIWLFNYLEKNEILDNDDYYKDLIPFLYDSIEHDIESNNFDLMHGVIVKLQTLINYYGVAHTTTKKYLDLFVDKLDASKIQENNRIFWYDEIYKDGSRGANLGYAHGLPSLLVFLLKLRSVNYTHHHLLPLAEGVINSLLGFKYDNRSDCSFPAVHHEIDAKNNLEGSRLAFCYGDLGVAFSLLYASKILDLPHLLTFSEEVVEKICSRSITSSSIMQYEEYNFIDTSFCHGISGILFMLMRINKVIKNDLLTYRINYWKDQLYHNLDTQLSIYGPIKFPYLRNPKDAEAYIIDEECILMGYSGTALVLISILYDRDDWSEFFLLDSLSQLN